MKSVKSESFRSSENTLRAMKRKRFDAAIYHGDCRNLLKSLPDNFVDLVITSPPYCIGKPYESATTTKEFVSMHEEILPEIVRVTRPGGSICWQVGYHVTAGVLTPLDFLVLKIAETIKQLVLRNRIIWTFGHGLHLSKRFSGRHETLLWFTKGENYSFDLDSVRVAQKYPGKRFYKGPRKGEFSGNPRGKSPGDVWDIPHVKSAHVEKTSHPCQFPTGIPRRLIRALTTPESIVFDPFCGVASTGVAAVMEGRRFLGAETDKHYVKTGVERILGLSDGRTKTRPIERPVLMPSLTDPLAVAPEHFSCGAND